MVSIRKAIFSIVIVLAGCLCASAKPGYLVSFSADTADVQVADTVELSDSAYMAMKAAESAAKGKKVVEKGVDVSHMISARRQRAVDVSEFTSDPFMANTFTSLRFTTTKMMSKDYGFGLMGGASFGKWLHEDHAVRLTYSIGKWQDTRDGMPITGHELDASYIFNLSSYVGGYRTNRFCELMIVSGVGLASASRSGNSGTAFSAHVGANVKMRLFKNIDFFVEPLANIYTNGIAVSKAGNWRSWMSSFQATCGLSYNIMQSPSGDSRALRGREDGWFISFEAGPHFQNSRHVYEMLKSKATGIHVGLGIGKYYTDYFAMRYSGTFARGGWVVYHGVEYPSNYFALRIEGMLDLVALIQHARHKETTSPFALSLLFGPEIGYMHKKDEKLVVGSAYMGLTGGIQAKYYFTDRFALFVEPRFSVVPYDAPLHQQTSSNFYRNYYDGLVNLNFGIEFKL